MATISKGIKLSYKTTGDTYTALTKLQSLPDLGGDTEAIEITTFDDAAHMYENGIKNYGDTLSFTFLYDATQFSTLNALAGQVDWKVELPDGENGALDTACTFSGPCSVKLDGTGINNALTYTLAIKPQTELTFA